MKLEIQETATVDLDTTDYKKAPKPEHKEWTAQNLGKVLKERSRSTKPRARRERRYR